MAEFNGFTPRESPELPDDPNSGNLSIAGGGSFGSLNISGVVTATAFVGDGSGLTNISGISQWITTAAGIHTLSNVGIGTTNPTSKLQVQGNTNINNLLPNIVSYASSFSVAAQDTTPTEVFFSNDGKSMYVVGDAGNDINYYSLSTPWSITSSSFVNTFSVASQITTPRGIYFKPDGTKFYIIGSTPVGSGVTGLNAYTCSSPWNISTASFDSVTFSVVSQETNPQGVEFKPDGTKFYIVGPTSDTVYQYSCSTPWDISTASYDNVNHSVNSQEVTPQGLRFSLDGTKLLVTGFTGDDVNYYTLSTPWDVSTTSFVGIITSLNIASFPITETSPTGLYWKPDGSKLYVVGSGSDAVYEFDVNSDANLEITGKFDVYGNSKVYQDLDVYGNSTFVGPVAVGLGTTSSPSNSQLSFELTSNTNLRIKVRGTDGVLRSANITLA